MSKTNTLETPILDKIFNDTALPWDANTDLYVSLHTADPGEGGAQDTNEASYGGYSRVAVARTSGGWTVSGNQASNAAAVDFPERTDVGSLVITHVGIGTAASGAGSLLFFGELSVALTVSLAIAPQFAIGTLVLQEN